MKRVLYTILTIYVLLLVGAIIAMICSTAIGSHIIMIACGIILALMMVWGVIMGAYLSWKYD